MKTATTIDQQLALLQERGMSISDREQARQTLLNVGYYRLGFYWFHLEKDVEEQPRKHQFQEGASFEQVVQLYQFDNQLRESISTYLHLIERSFKTRIIYYTSNRYRENSTWFVASEVVGKSASQSIKQKYAELRKNPIIALHHKRHKQSKHEFAPAWKTVEYFTFGDLCLLYQGLGEELRQTISLDYGLRNTGIMDSYIHALRQLRNACAHGHNLYDFSLPRPLRTTGPVCIRHRHSAHLGGLLTVMHYLLQHISCQQAQQFRDSIKQTLQQPPFIEACIRHYGLTEFVQNA